MKKILFLIFTFSLLIPCAFSQGKTLTQAEYDRKMQWWRDAKFGLFIHWGPYSLYGGTYNGFRQQRGGAEWIMNRCKIPVREYRAKASTFDPINYDAQAIVNQAKKAGMKYIIFTTKHHDGFAMFKSNVSEFNIVDYTPFKRDIVAELADACRKNDMKLGFYYSQSQDWCNAGGATATKQMWEGWPNPDSTAINDYVKANNGSWDCLQTTASFEEYFYKTSLPQIKELLTNYGDVAVMWWDTPMGISDQLAQKITDELAKYPQVITNDRLKRPNFPGDYKTPEGKIPRLEDVAGIDWETCMNIGSSWGYKSYEKNWKQSKDLIQSLITIVARGGNYLLNIGPDPTGKIPDEAVNRLNDMGVWMQIYGEAIYGTQRSPIHPDWGQITRKDKEKSSDLYLCVFNWPKDGKLVLDADYKVKKASMVHDGTILKVAKKNGQIIVDVPLIAPNEVASVIKLELSQKLPEVKLISNSQKAFEIVDEKD
ncbi:MAG: alpha-L-fucosidase [Dysgonomonas sp.]